MNKLLEIKSLSMQFGGLKALQDITFDIYENEVVGLIGPNGAGKTTLFNCITQFYKNYEGNVILHNGEGAVDLGELKVTDVITKGLVRTFQNIELIPDLTIIDNVLIGAHSILKSNFFYDLFNVKKKREEDRLFRQKAKDILELLNIRHLKDQYVKGQPYGILKKIEIARTLITDPKIIILDEPAAGLNDVETDELEQIVKDIQKRYHMAVLIIEHDMGFVMNVCDRVCAINFGKFLAIDTPAKIQKNKLVQEAYLGSEESDA